MKTARLLRLLAGQCLFEQKRQQYGIASNQCRRRLSYLGEKVRVFCPRRWQRGLLGLLLCCGFVPSYASYTIIIDAGSSGSRIHLFQSTATSLRELALSANKVTPGLATFADESAAAEQALHPLFTAVQQSLQQQNVQQAQPVYLLATAGMRLLPADKAAALYSVVTTAINKQPLLFAKEVDTLSGEREAVFAWLAVNYLSGSLETPEKTIGIIELGGASLQVAFLCSDCNAADSELLSFQGQLYPLYAKSFLGLGVEQIRQRLQEDSSCFPKGYKTQKPFHPVRCYQSLSALIADVERPQSRLPTEMLFQALASFAYTVDFFTPKNSASLSLAMSGGVCEQTWQQLQQLYPTMPRQYLANYCVDGTYQSLLLTEFLGFAATSQQLQIGNSVAQHPMSWPLGAALYYWQHQQRGE